MEKSEVVIIGAGIAGLTAAVHLDRAGISCRILEKSSEVGGRIRSISKNGFVLDAGFQVLHPNYPEVRNSGVWESLVFSPFRAGALISREKNLTWYSNPVADPVGFLRSGFNFPFSAAEIPAAISLFKEALSSDEDFFFHDSGTSCYEYLRLKGISEKTIRNFFVPFFGGVFLDEDLGAGYRYFLWLFRKFLQGNPGLPHGGIQRLPLGLLSMLPVTQNGLKFNSEVKGIDKNQIYCRDGYQIHAKYIIDSANLDNSPPIFRGTRNYYFEGPVSSQICNSLILNGNRDGDIMHFCFPSAVQKSYAPAGRALCSVTLKNHLANPDPAALLKELALLYPGMPWKEWNFLHSFHIPEAIPAFTGRPGKSFRRKENFFNAGDGETYSSINGAMRSGREAAECIISEVRNS